MSKNFLLPNLLVLHFGQNLVKIRTKIAKLQMHENVHKNVNENIFFIHIFMQTFISFYEGQLKQLISYMLFNPFKMAVQFF